MYYGSWDGLKWSAINVLWKFGRFEVIRCNVLWKVKWFKVICYKCIMELGRFEVISYKLLWNLGWFKVISCNVLWNLGRFQVMRCKCFEVKRCCYVGISLFQQNLFLYFTVTKIKSSSCPIWHWVGWHLLQNSF